MAGNRGRFLVPAEMPQCQAQVEERVRLCVRALAPITEPIRRLLHEIEIQHGKSNARPSFGVVSKGSAVSPKYPPEHFLAFALGQSIRERTGGATLRLTLWQPRENAAGRPNRVDLKQKPDCSCRDLNIAGRF